MGMNKIVMLMYSINRVKSLYRKKPQGRNEPAKLHATTLLLRSLRASFFRQP
jgi:hypothetical protein